MEVGVRFKSDAKIHLVDVVVHLQEETNILLTEVNIRFQLDTSVHHTKVSVRFQSDADIHLREVCVRFQVETYVHQMDVGVRFWSDSDIYDCVLVRAALPFEGTGLSYGTGVCNRSATFLHLSRVTEDA